MTTKIKSKSKVTIEENKENKIVQLYEYNPKLFLNPTPNHHQKKSIWDLKSQKQPQNWVKFKNQN